MNQKIRYIGFAIATLAFLIAFFIPLTNWSITIIATLFIGGIIIADYPYEKK